LSTAAGCGRSVKEQNFASKRKHYGSGAVVYLLQELTLLGDFGIYYEGYTTLHRGPTEKECKERLEEILKDRHSSSIVKSEIVYQKN